MTPLFLRMSRLVPGCFALLLAALIALPAPAQDTPGPSAPTAPATLLADTVEIDAEGRLVASGNVEALQGEARLTATRIVYDQATDSLRIDGPITLTLDNETLLLASEAEISSSLRDGLLRSARVVFNRRLQLAAPEINRVDGRYLQLNNVVASSCEVCAARPVPLWQIRASRVISDELERQLYFDDARFEVYGVPVFYLPRLRLPGPGLERATGFLVPQITSSSEIGVGAKLPYFIALSPSRDLLLTPWITSGPTATLQARYRQAFASGTLSFEGAVTQDDIRPDDMRGYLFGQGAFRLPKGYRLNFDVETATDEDYLDTYGFSGKDRLDSALAITRARRDEWFRAETIAFSTPGTDWASETRPSLLGDVEWTRRTDLGGLGGVATFELSAHAHERPSGTDIAGRDVQRIAALAGWRADHVGPAGVLFGAEARLLAEYTTFGDDSTAPEGEGRIVPAAAVELRWPWVRAGRGGTAHLIEPVAQIVWTPNDAVTDRPTEESTQLELDPANLYSLSRFGAYDAVEAGLRANLGIGYTVSSPDGLSLGMALGRILRAEDLGQFDSVAALDGTASDWLFAVDLQVATGVSLSSRALFDDDFSADRLETRFGWSGDGFDLAGSYAWLDASPSEGRTEAINQWRLDGSFRVSDRWQASADIAYDLDRSRPAETEIGIEYRTECVTMDFGWLRRFTAPDQDDPSERFTFEIALAGFGGTDSGPRPRPRRCIR